MVKRFLKQKLKDGEDFLYLHRGPLELLEIKLQGCRLCQLSLSRNRLVFGEGLTDARIMLIGEAPGKDEDKEGRPFIGRAGRLLRSMLNEVELKDIYITNIVKCHPPYDRDPRSEEIAACLPYLRAQISIIRPELIITLGRISSRTLIGEEISITKIHGKIYEYGGIRVLPTFHPAFLIRNPNFRIKGLNDLQKAKGLTNG
jgi:DNA polymerase